MSKWDTEILLWINCHYSDFMDSLMWLSSGTLTWIPLYVVMLVVLWSRMSVPADNALLRVGRWRGHRHTVQRVLLILTIVLLVLLTDQTCHVLKHWIARPRPSHAPELEGLVRSLHGYKGGLYGHPSSHAANTMALAVFLLTMLRTTATKNTTFALWVVLMSVYVLLNCYSRMYLGVHYPSDIIFGLIVGVLWGGLASGALRRLCVGVGRLACSQNGRTDRGSESS